MRAKHVHGMHSLTSSQRRAIPTIPGVPPASTRSHSQATRSQGRCEAGRAGNPRPGTSRGPSRVPRLRWRASARPLGRRGGHRPRQSPRARMARGVRGARSRRPLAPPRACGSSPRASRGKKKEQRTTRCDIEWGTRYAHAHDSGGRTVAAANGVCKKIGLSARLAAS